VAATEVKISKRAGSYVTLRDLIEWTSKDAVRFFLLSRKPDTEYTFDVDLAVAEEQRQPGVLRAVRPCAHLLGAGWLGRDATGLESVSTCRPAQSAGAGADAALAKYPEMLAAAAPDFAPHDVTFYLRELAAAYHSYYDAERILVDDETGEKGPSGAGRGHRPGVAQWPGRAGRERAGEDVTTAIHP
jgi:arginyl-tRNA synthetase